MATELPDVREGDVWADNDRRARENPPRKRVVRVNDIYIAVRKVRPDGSPFGTEALIQRRRFRPTATGYRLVERDGKPVDGADAPR